MNKCTKFLGLVRISRNFLCSLRCTPALCDVPILRGVAVKSLVSCIHTPKLHSFKFFTTMGSQDINIEQLKEFQKDKNVLIVDVREHKEIAETGVLPGAVHIPLGELPDALMKEPGDFEKIYGRPKPKKGSKIVFSCRSGRRSLVALNKAKELGYNNLLNFAGGWLEWEAHLPKN